MPLSQTRANVETAKVWAAESPSAARLAQMLRRKRSVEAWVAADYDQWRMLIHSVYFWFKPDADPERVAGFAAGLADLLKIPDIQSAHFGKPEATPKRAVIDDSYDWGLIEIFPDLEAHDRYQAHPIHAEFLRRFAALWDKVQVYDVRI